MSSDLSIAHSVKLRPIDEVAEKVGLLREDLIRYGDDKAKIKYSTVSKLLSSPHKGGKLILVTAMTPTPHGEGKTTMSIGLTQGLVKLGKKAIVALREPSLGPCFGMKGGAAGGGYSQVLPMEDINLHFTGDLHAVTAAHNLISSVLDNHLYFNASPERALNLKHLYWKRVMDMNDRSLRQMVTGLGKNGLVRETGFDITAASEIMAILCLSKNYDELKQRIGNILLGLDLVGKNPFYARELKIEGAASLLLKEALLPNLVQTLEHGPALIHGGPFANIAQGANSVLATKLAMQLADYTVTEAGFASDLGGEKFLNIVSRYGEFSPQAMVIVATCRALKYHSGATKEEQLSSNPSAVLSGCCNLMAHVEHGRLYQIPVIVAINPFPTDTEEELLALENFCKDHAIPYSMAPVWASGGEGGLDLAKKVVEMVDQGGSLKVHKPLYEWSESVTQKIETIAQKVYGATNVFYLPKAKEDLELIDRCGLSGLPICMAKTQSSLSDNPKLLGRPKGFTLSVREIIISSGAGFLVPITGEMMRMPGLPKIPAAFSMDIDNEGKVSGLF